MALFQMSTEHLVSRSTLQDISALSSKEGATGSDLPSPPKEIEVPKEARDALGPAGKIRLSYQNTRPQGPILLHIISVNLER
jgi:hypothetical protein